MMLSPPELATTAPSILFQDAHCVVVNKPAGLIVHRGWANDRVTMMSLVRDHIGNHVHPVHRLDRATSGALLFALDPESAEQLQRAFDAGQVVKNYLALTRGLTPLLGLIDHGLRKSKAHERRPARTAMRRLGSFERYSLVEARPFTGRQHQLRRHLKHIAHPLIGDTRYGKGEHNRYFREHFDLQRLALHASKLKFPHPFGGESVEVRAPLPPELAACWGRIGVLALAEAACTGPVWEPQEHELPILAQD